MKILEFIDKQPSNVKNNFIGASLCFSLLFIILTWFAVNDYIDYLDKESKRAIMFKIVDSNYVCEDILKFAEENL